VVQARLAGERDIESVGEEPTVHDCRQGLIDRHLAVGLSGVVEGTTGRAGDTDVEDRNRLEVVGEMIGQEEDDAVGRNRGKVLLDGTVEPAQLLTRGAVGGG
jgi:hypothetical protein